MKSKERAPARAYAIRAKEEASAPNVIVGNFTLFDTIVTLIDIGSTHSYICTTVATQKELPVELTKFDILVLNPLGQSVRVTNVCKNYP